MAHSTQTDIVLKLLFQGKKYSMTTVLITGGKQLKAGHCSQLPFTCGGFSAVTSLTAFPSFFFKHDKCVSPSPLSLVLDCTRLMTVKVSCSRGQHGLGGNSRLQKNGLLSLCMFVNANTKLVHLQVFHGGGIEEEGAC